MRYFVEFSLLNFPAWSGGKDTKDSIISVGRVDDFNDLMDSLYQGQDDVSETDVNDFLWFERDFIACELGS